MTSYKSIFHLLMKARRWIREILAVLFVCRFSFFVALAMLAILVFVSQGQEVLRAAAEKGIGVATALLLSTLACGTLCWYWARVLLYFDIYDLPSNRRITPLITWLPRFLGFSVIVSVSVALCEAAGAFREAGAAPEAVVLVVLSAVGGICGIVFLMLVTYRRRILGLENLPRPGSVRLSELPRSTRGMVAAIAIVSILLVAGFRVAYLWVGDSLNTASIVLLAGCSWVTFGSILVYVSHRLHLPVLSVLFLVALLSGYLFEYHPVRVLWDKVPTCKSTLADRFSSWSRHHAMDSSRPLPVVIVTAEGGGIRAAYWTASILCTLEDSLPGFTSHVFALSGASGGSLGGAVYASLVGEKSRQPSLGGHLGENAQGILSEDFLAPTLGVMLFPEVMQLLPGFNLIRADRASALEDSWSASWSRHMKQGGTDSELFDGPFCDLWKDHPDDVPSLFLNGTSVEQGNRLIMSNVCVDGGEFFDALDIHSIMKHDTRLSTAVLMSARFTYVSPAGLLPDPCKHPWGHVVDGGYFDNSGAETAFDILLALADTLADTSRFRTCVLVITNEPGDTGWASPNIDGRESDSGILQLAAPFETMLNTRGAHGRYAVEALRGLVTQNGGMFEQYGIGLGHVPIPLGWQLSQSAMREMNSQLLLQLGGRSPDSRLTRLERFLRSTETEPDRPSLRQLRQGRYRSSPPPPGHADPRRQSSSG